MAFRFDAGGQSALPDAVVLVHTLQELRGVFRECMAQEVPLVIRGSGTNLCGGATVDKGGVMIVTASLTAIVQIDSENRSVCVEPGVITKSLESVLYPFGLFYAPDPGSYHVSTIGGNVAANAGGMRGLRYGVTTHHVLALEVLLASGTAMRTPSSRDHRAVLDITGLIVGSEGTLALIQTAELALQPRPEATGTLLASFQTISQAMAAVAELVARDYPILALELMDRPSMDIVEPYVHAGYPQDAAAVLLIESEGSRASLDLQLQAIRNCLDDFHAAEVQTARDPVQRDKLWQGRRAQYGAAARLAPRIWVQDVAVPRPALASMMEEVTKISQRWDVRIFTVAHAGDGNLHPDIPYHPGDAEMVSRVHAAVFDILQAAVSLGGSISGEHGIGTEKLPYLPMMFSVEEMVVMAGIKHAFDPHGLLNPGKAIGKSPVPEGRLLAPPVRELDQSRQDLQEIIRSCPRGQTLQAVGHSSRMPQGLKSPLFSRPVPTGRFTRIIHIYAQNLTVTPEGGVGAADLAAALAACGLAAYGLDLADKGSFGGLIASYARFWRDSYAFGMA
jgi:D-lactate dehydrogenase (cytochrome)/glycolate oxidase